MFKKIKMIITITFPEHIRRAGTTVNVARARLISSSQKPYEGDALLFLPVSWTHEGLEGHST